MTARCPLCSRRTEIVAGKLARHKADDEWCQGGGHTTFQATVILARAMASKGGPSHG
jgi:hypothetical protein